jgi:hypothetical protein
MPLTPKGEKIMGNMKEQYGSEKAKEVFYASENKGTISGVHDASEHDPKSGQFTSGSGGSKPTPKSFWSYQASSPTPEHGSAVAAGRFRGSKADWEGLSPGMRREIMRTSSKDKKDEPEEAGTPVRRPNLLGTVCSPNGIKPAEVEMHDATPDRHPETGQFISGGGSTTKVPSTKPPSNYGEKRKPYGPTGATTWGHTDSKDQDMMSSGASPSASMSSPSSMSSTGVSSSTTGSTSSGTMVDSKDEEVKAKEIKSATPPMNNLSRSGNPGAVTGNLVPYSGITVGDSLHNQNVRNRAFWSRKRR